MERAGEKKERNKECVEALSLPLIRLSLSNPVGKVERTREKKKKKKDRNKRECVSNSLRGLSLPLIRLSLPNPVGMGEGRKRRKRSTENNREIITVMLCILVALIVATSLSI